MRHDVKAEYSRSLVSSAAWKFWMKKHQQDAILSVIALLIVVYLFFFENNREWYVGFFLAISIVYVVMIYGGFLAIRRSSLAALRSMGTPSAVWSFSEESIQCESGAGRAEIKWTSIEKLWRFELVWLFEFANGTYSTLPIATLAPDTKQFIEVRVRNAGGKIT